MNNKTSGFTLIELVIVVAIISILTAVAMPSFLDYQRKTARTQAKGVMLDIAQKQERYFTNRGSYLAFPAAPTALSGAATAFQNYSGSDINSRKFSIKVEAGDTADITTSYLITADASNGYTDPLCPTMTLASSSATKSPSECW